MSLLAVGGRERPMRHEAADVAAAPSWPGIEILGVRIAQLERPDAVARVERLCERDRPGLLVYANAHTLNTASKDPGFRRILASADLVLNDGSGVALAARLRGERFPENLNGTDFNLDILELCARRGWPVYLLGARPGVAERAAERLQERIPALEVVGTRHGFLSEGEDREVAGEIRRTGARVLMVAMGQPLQERWLAEHLPATGCRLGVAVGAFLDFSAGEVPRAPRWMSAAGVEWLYRLRQEPLRLWRRYLVGNPAFMTRVLRERLTETARLGRERARAW